MLIGRECGHLPFSSERSVTRIKHGAQRGCDREVGKDTASDKNCGNPLRSTHMVLVKTDVVGRIEGGTYLELGRVFCGRV